MTLLPPRVPADKGPLYNWLQYLVRWITSERVIQIMGFTVKETTDGKYFVPNPTVPQLAGLVWQTPNKELDPTKSVLKNTLVYVSPQNPIVTTGLTDLVSGSVTNASAGVYCAAQNIPAQVTVSGTVKYNVPVNPVPGAPSATSGSPLSGDYDGTNVYWLPVTGLGSSTAGNFSVYNNANAYVQGDIVYVASTTTISGITILPGTYGCVTSVSASGTGNQIPQIPAPASGTVYWIPIAAGLVVAGTCSAGGTGSVYVNATATF